jgi:hypothetical protein
MLNRQVVFALRNGHGLPGLSGPKSANKRLMHRSNFAVCRAGTKAVRPGILLCCCADRGSHTI